MVEKEGDCFAKSTYSRLKIMKERKSFLEILFNWIEWKNYSKYLIIDSEWDRNQCARIPSQCSNRPITLFTNFKTTHLSLINCYLNYWNILEIVWLFNLQIMSMSYQKIGMPECFHVNTLIFIFPLTLEGGLDLHYSNLINCCITYNDQNLFNK